MPVVLETTDAANSTATTATMGVGDYFYGDIETNSDSDWVSVTLVAGETYTFGLVGLGLYDPILYLRDATGATVMTDDDGGPGRNSNITFTASTSGTFFLDVQSFGNSYDGGYGLSMVVGDRASYDVVMGAGNLIREQLSWAVAPETAATVTWSIRDSGTEPSGGNPFIAPTAAQISAISEILDDYAGISGLTFNQVNAGGTSNDSTMVFGAYNANDGSGAYAYYPGNPATGSNSGDVWLNNNAGSTTSLEVGSYSHFVILHEVGHAIGLAHPGDYNAALGVSITYANNAQFTEDSHQYTVMSYFDESNTTTSVGGYPDTLLMFDMLALHALYGADMTYHSGNTVYGFNATVGGAFDFTTNTNPLLCIWDGNGEDTIDLSGYAMAQFVTLSAGEFSDVGGYAANVSIAIGAVIENAIGGSGDDTLLGNEVANAIYGGAGGDTIEGNDGDDFLYGNQGVDNIDGGAGSDFIRGGQDDDIIDGGSGSDTLDGGDGKDIISGGGGGDTIYGGDSGDTINGNASNDEIYGGSGRDIIDGGGHNDLIRGENGFDLINGGKGNDFLYGDDGEDRVYGDQGNDQVFGNKGNDALYGGSGHDLLHGGDDDDRIVGGSGNDLIIGGKGDDVINGGADDDDLFGNLGNDTFIFNNNIGVDTIHDFEATNDLEVIDFSGYNEIVDFTDLVNNHMAQVSGDVVISDLLGNQIILEGIDINDLLDGNDFLF